MSTKCTPGPWSHHGDYVKANRGLGYIARMSDYDRNEQIANACLMAAAPDLLDALIWVRDNCTGLPAVAHALADKAISKAKGEE